MVQKKDSTPASPKKGVRIGVFSEKPVYSSPEFSTISAVAGSKKPAGKHREKLILPNENKPFLIEDLFMTKS